MFRALGTAVAVTFLALQSTDKHDNSLIYRPDTPQASTNKQGVIAVQDKSYMYIFTVVRTAAAAAAATHTVNFATDTYIPGRSLY
jgi:hypothetical protein